MSNNFELQNSLKTYLLEGDSSATARGLQDFLSFKKSVPEKRCAEYDEQGFTLVEAMVTLVILTTALIPALFLSTQATNVSFSIKNNLAAANLAQEGIEIVRAIRDNNWFQSLDFDNNITAGTWRVDWNSDTLIALGSNPALKINNGLYNYSAGTDSLFKRTITVTKVNAAELQIVSNVTWTERGNRAKSITAESHLFNWR
ncbi:MAG: hypothetical protein UU54_C0005G0017 [Candidatus Yanofskybacteria bacterium GW2011_GWA2_41_22]|uniref:Uncharacterized protein n=3 Tax=Candidatus Yanofskyibacteriota TaxID=1752733 RepID=A0A1F8HWP8_9BACT|nr:MAG: hypothetical protein US65_C0012G0004 [Candidatus Yanofskybacteria bacterium GW2011_GWC2_37_9]KKS01407.1 MAG: hypothetical protein UU54_C0005G0017 [Candidatus Yanofskybacteria bacterium GW2011_GWA2_41_22]OGN10095.1 MAG: hypothetical protein A3C64_02750 [Candidatus Yanofskybacteria bacterium RIFCSPHIGHO2_02_FULL_41_12]OGN20774.1 MAG: hypothetical protein A3B00_02875 [Candidatus Yanofskybacteria bacterium RIFCSPLOWO2_01_FULL_41_33]OGN41568.1 MAG: hypothetical protein A2606_00055 [Candidatu